mgnify:CR=1 FL=1
MRQDRGGPLLLAADPEAEGDDTDEIDGQDQEVDGTAVQLMPPLWRRATVIRGALVPRCSFRSESAEH